MKAIISNTVAKTAEKKEPEKNVKISHIQRKIIPASPKVKKEDPKKINLDLPRRILKASNKPILVIPKNVVKFEKTPRVSIGV